MTSDPTREAVPILHARLRAALPVLAVLVLALALRILDSAPGSACRQYDEYHDIFGQRLPLWESITEFLADTVGGLSGHLIYRPVLRAFAYSPTAGRLFSIALDLVALCVLVLWCRNRSGLGVALCVGTLYAASPTLLSFICQARYYALFNLGMTLSYLALIDRVTGRGGRWADWMLAIGGIVVMLGHYWYGCVWLAAVASAALYLAAIRRRSDLLSLALVVAIVGLAALPQVPIYLRQRRLWEDIAWSHVFPDSLWAYAGSPIHWYGSRVASVALLVLVVFGWRDTVRPFAGAPRGPTLRTFAGMAACFIVATTAIASAYSEITRIPLFAVGRQEIVFAPLVCLVLGHVAGSMQARRIRLLVLLSIVVLSIRLAGKVGLYSWDEYRPDPGKVAFLDRHVGDAHVYDYACSLKYELANALGTLKPDSVYRDFFRFTPRGRRRMVGAMLEVDLAQGKTVLLILPDSHDLPDCENWLAGLGYKTSRPATGDLPALYIRK